MTRIPAKNTKNVGAGVIDVMNDCVFGVFCG